jgi:molybdopterin/thiamine biosynthesis adenylyltransferase
MSQLGADPPRIVVDLTDEERAIHEWQMWARGFGESGQRRLKSASVLVSRCGGVGGTAAYYLAAAGVGRLVLAHAGNIKPSDLNRQLLMTHAGLGTSRIASAAQRLRELNPRVTVTAVGENISESNAAALVREADLVMDCAPLFEERFLMNREAVRQGKPLVDAAMFELEGQLTTILPGRTPCLACIYPTAALGWKREFPVIGAVAGTFGALAALEAIKVLTGIGEPITNQLLVADLGQPSFRKVPLRRNPRCRVCGEITPELDKPTTEAI